MKSHFFTECISSKMFLLLFSPVRGLLTVATFWYWSVSQNNYLLHYVLTENFWKLELLKFFCFFSIKEIPWSLPYSHGLYGRNKCEGLVGWPWPFDVERTYLILMKSVIILLFWLSLLLLLLFLTYFLWYFHDIYKLPKLASLAPSLPFSFLSYSTQRKLRGITGSWRL